MAELNNERAPETSPETDRDALDSTPTFGERGDRSDMQLAARGGGTAPQGDGPTYPVSAQTENEPLVINRNSTGTTWGAAGSTNGTWTAVQREYSANSEGRLVVTSRTLTGRGAMPEDLENLRWNTATPSTVTMNNVRVPATIPESWSYPNFTPTAASTLASGPSSPSAPSTPSSTPSSGPSTPSSTPATPSSAPARDGLTIERGVSGSTFWAGSNTEGGWQAVRRDYSADSDGRLVVSTRTLTGTGALPGNLRGLSWNDATPTSVTMNNVRVPVTIPQEWSSADFQPASTTRLPSGGSTPATPVTPEAGPRPAPPAGPAAVTTPGLFLTTYGAAGSLDGTWAAVQREYGSNSDGRLVVTSRTITGTGAMPRDLRNLDFSGATPSQVTMTNVRTPATPPQEWSYPSFRPTASSTLSSR